MICITLGNKTHLCITESNHLAIVQDGDRPGKRTTINLGLATKIRIEQLQDTLGRLYKHGLDQEKAA